jgi:hypothetical protein
MHCQISQQQFKQSSTFAAVRVDGEIFALKTKSSTNKNTPCDRRDSTQTEREDDKDAHAQYQLQCDLRAVDCRRAI